MDFASFLHIITLLIGIVACLIGIMAFLKPTPLSAGFGIPVKGTASGYVMALGVRDIFVGVIFLHVYFTENWSAAGPYGLALGAVALGDFLIVFKNGEKAPSAIHFAGAVVSFIYAALFFTLPISI